MKTRPAFSLIETLVAIAILSVLGSITVGGIRSARNKAAMTVELNAARNLITAYLGHASENGGRVLSGYKNDPNATNLDGDPLSDPINARYPWRLAPHVPKIEGNILFNGNEKALNSPNSDYLVSVQPNLGLNATLVGGHFGSGSPLPPTPRLIQTYGKFHLTNLAESSSPESLIVFASARSSTGEPGYFEIRPPNLTKPIWPSAKFSKSSPPHHHGHVDLRWNQKAVAVMLAGNASLLNESQLRDMRRWSHQAANSNQPNFLISPIPSN